MLTPKMIEQLMASSAETFQNPYVMQLMGDLAARRPKSEQLVAQLQERSASNTAMWPVHAITMPLAIVEAQGSRLLDADGNSYIDLFMGFSAQALHGHNHPEVVEHFKSQIANSPGCGYFHPVEIELVDLLRRLTGQEEWVFLHSGTDATQAAARICRTHTKKSKIARFDFIYHGSHDWGIQTYSPFFCGYPFTRPYPRLTEQGLEKIPLNEGAALRDEDLLILPNMEEKWLRLLDEHRDEIAGVFCSAASLNFPYPEKSTAFAQKVRERCRELGLLFVLDEVQTGFRWDGPGGANRALGLDADLCTYGKVISGLGLPLSGVAGRHELIDHFRTTRDKIQDWGRKSSLMTTHQANHMSLAASFASLSLLERKGPEYYTRTRARGERLKASARALQAEGIPLHFQGYGDFCGTWFFAHEPDKTDTPNDWFNTVNLWATTVLLSALRREGFYSYSYSTAYLGDAYSDEDIDAIDEAVKRVAREMKAAGLALVPPWAEGA